MRSAAKMNNELQVFSYKEQEVRTAQIRGEMWFFAEDVCSVLGLMDSTKAIEGLERDEKAIYFFGHNEEANIISESGLYALIMRSEEQQAKEFRRWVTSEVLPTICKTLPDELELRRKELEIRSNEVNLRRAELIRDMLNNPPFPVTPETRTVFAHEIFQLATGHSYLAMLPESAEKWYTATEIGAKLGISANEVVRIAKANGINPPEEESNEYGRWIYSKSQYSSREVASVIYNENALEWFMSHEN